MRAAVYVGDPKSLALEALKPNPPGPRCITNSASVKLTPGLTNTPAVQRMKIKGTLQGCEGEPFTAATYKGTLQTAGPVTCAALTEPSEPAIGTVKFKWTPATKPATSVGTMSVPFAAASTIQLVSNEITFGRAFEFSGEVQTGAHSPLAFTGTALTRYFGGSRCGVPKSKAVKAGEVSNSEVGFP